MNPLYFAYGSNMNNNQMRWRCPKATNLGPACLPGWTLCERLHADIDEDPEDAVHGVLWEITPECLAALDLYEGVPTYYIKQWVDVISDMWHAPIPAIVYVMSARSKKHRGIYRYDPEYALGCAVGAEQNEVPVHPLYMAHLIEMSKESA